MMFQLWGLSFSLERQRQTKAILGSMWLSLEVWLQRKKCPSLSLPLSMMLRLASPFLPLIPAHPTLQHVRRILKQTHAVVIMMQSTTSRGRLCAWCDTVHHTSWRWPNNHSSTHYWWCHSRRFRPIFHWSPGHQWKSNWSSAGERCYTYGNPRQRP